MIEPLQTRRLTLRTMEWADVDALLGIFGDPAVMAAFEAPPFTREQMEAWVRRNLAHQEAHGFGLFSVFLTDGGRLIGDCGLEHMLVGGVPAVELGYDIRADCWNRGFATEAAVAVRDHAFHAIGVTRLVSLIRAGNDASRRVAEKIGMRPVEELSRFGRPYVVYALDRDPRTLEGRPRR